MVTRWQIAAGRRANKAYNAAKATKWTGRAVKQATAKLGKAKTPTSKAVKDPRAGRYAKDQSPMPLPKRAKRLRRPGAVKGIAAYPKQRVAPKGSKAPISRAESSDYKDRGWIANYGAWSMAWMPKKPKGISDAYWALSDVEAKVLRASRRRKR